MTTGEPRRALVPGDVMPRLVLLDADGGKVDLQHQSIAGDTVVLWFAGEAADPARLARLEAMLDAFAAVEARPFVVLTSAGEAGERAVPILLDPERRVPAGLAIDPPAVLVVSPRGRVAALLAGDALDEALACARALFGTGEPVVHRGGAPVLIVPEVVEPALAARLIGYWEQGEKVADQVASSREAGEAAARIKRRSDVVIQDRTLFETLRTRILARVVPELRRAFRFEVASFEALRIGCYDAAAGGYFRRHRDNATPYTAHRGFAMSLNLNTGDYAGGCLRFPEFGRDLYEPPLGGAVLFSCSLLHEALPVTAGRRFAVFTFFADAAGAARERQMAERQLAAGRSGVTIG